MDESHKAVRLQANKAKILEAILLLIAEGIAMGEEPTQYEIVKSVFLADTAHLEAYGRPVTFDNYYAMEFGPVAEETYDMLKPEYPGRKHFGGEWPLWDTKPSGSARRYVRPRRLPNLAVLSRSDADALRAALVRVRALNFGGTKDETHRHPAYQEAWAAAGRAKSRRMDYARIAPEGSEAAEDIAHASKFL